MKLRRFLFAMALAILAPVIVFSAISLQMLMAAERETAVNGLQETARATGIPSS